MRRIVGLLAVAMLMVMVGSVSGCGGSSTSPVDLGPGDHRSEEQKTKETEQMDKMRPKKAATRK